MSELSKLPSVDEILRSSHASEWIERYGRPITVAAIRQTLSDVRSSFPKTGVLPSTEKIQDAISSQLDEWFEPTLVPVINATGVILHTNLGRAPLSQSAAQAVQAVIGQYNTLEFNLKSGKRGSRSIHAEVLLKLLTGAEAALVVNNNAAAVLLVLTTLARRRRVIIARSQLVEIGGGFRVPEVMKQSGARLVEIGTTNRIHLADYEEALEEPAAMVLRAHHSNFRIIGFTEEPDLSDIVSIAHERDTMVVDDLGSGALLDTAQFGLAHEPMVQESLNAGVDLVCFSGDKLLGGPQAGLIVGRKALIDRVKKHPLARAVRADKLCLSALSATLYHYLRNEGVEQIPIWQMIAANPEKLRAKALKWQAYLSRGEVVASVSTVGGGSLPEETLPTFVLALPVSNPDRFSLQLRQMHPPLITRVENDRIIIDPRTVLPNQEDDLLEHLDRLLK
jgi:L-seryl-tRNA(Ser) seleniumtransferase